MPISISGPASIAPNVDVALREFSSTTVDEDDLGKTNDEILGMENVVGYRSYPSRSTPSVDIPDPKGLKLQFVYNFFTPDERVRSTPSPEEQIINLKTSEEAQVLYELTNERHPRYVRVSFEPPKFLKQDDMPDLPGESILNNLDKIIIEGASSSKYFSGTEIVDTLSDQNFYNLGKLSLLVQRTTVPDDSPTANAHNLANKIKKDQLFGNSKKLILDVMSDLQPEGYSYAKSDTRREQVEAAYDSAARQSFSLKLNNLFFNDIMLAASRQPASVFEDEIRAFTAGQSIGAEIQQSGINQVDATRVMQDEYEFYAKAVKTKKLATNLVSSGDDINTRPQFRITGYIVQRFEVNNNGSVTPLEPLILENPNSTYIVDNNVRYGGTYIYKIRTIALISVVARRVSLSIFGAPTEYVKSTFMIASEGVSGVIDTNERVPPPPPSNLTFRYDYDHRKPAINWQFPINPQRDIARFQIFKRSSVEEPFKLLAEYNFDSSIIKSRPLERGFGKRIVRMRYPVVSFIDKSFNDGDVPIYAIAAIDAHGMTSNYSEQFQISYNKMKNKIETKLISKVGAPKPYPNLYLNTDTFQDLMKTSGKDRMTIVFDPEYYIVTEKRNVAATSQILKSAGVKELWIEDDLKLIGVDPNRPTYKIQIINTDLQQSEVVNITISDKTSTPLEVPAAKISKNNLSFEFGVKAD